MNKRLLQLLLVTTFLFGPVLKIGAQPNITSFSPSFGPVGTLVTVTGSNFNSINAFSIGGTTAVIVSNTGKVLTGMVMPGAVTGPVSLTDASGTGTGNSNFIVTQTNAPTLEQTKLTANGNTGPPFHGDHVAISADGNTAVVSGTDDNNGIGAIWIYVRSGNTWAQQGPKLVATGYKTKPAMGASLAISADGNTVIAGGWLDDIQTGGAWVFVRNNGTWAQQGSSLKANDLSRGSGFGYAVALSADGNTAVVGSIADITVNTLLEAASVFTRNNGVWTQQGPKLQVTGHSHFIGGSGERISLALSADGNTTVIGLGDDTPNGAIWIFTRSGTTWSQQGSKLVGTGQIDQSVGQGISVSVSADANTILVGAPGDANNHGNIGAAWIFVRNGGTWTQQGPKLVGTGYGNDNVYQGNSVSLSADGNIAVIGGPADNSSQGSFWIFMRTGTVWTQKGNKMRGTGVLNYAYQGNSVAMSADAKTMIIGGPADNTRIGAAWIYVTDPISITTATTDATCRQNNGSITVTAGNGIAPYTYSIDGQTFILSNSFTGTPSGNYTVTVRDAVGSSNSVGVSVGNTCPVIMPPVIIDDSCANANGKIILSAIKGTVPYRYSLDGLSFQTSNTFTSLFAGNYRIILEDAQSFRDTVNLIVKNNCLQVTAISIDATCSVANAVITVTGSGGIPPYSYSRDGINFQSSNRFSAVAPGNYIVTIKDANGTIGSAFDTIRNIAGPSAVSASTITALCNNTKGGITLTSNGGTAPFQYSIDGVNYQSSNQFINDTAGIYSVSVKDTNGCIANNTATVSRYPTPIVDLGKDTTICAGQTILLQAGNSFTNYIWSNGITASSQIVTSAGKYFVTITDGNNCKISDTIAIAVQNLPVFSLGNDTSLCAKQSLALQINATGNYLWNDATTQNKKTITTPGVYWAETTNLGCVFRDSIKINYISLPALHFPADTILCDKSTLLLDATQNGNASTYSWQDGSTSPTYQIKESGIYFVKVVQNGCVNADTSNVIYQQIPKQIIDNDTSKCTKSSIVLDVTFPNANYVWKDLSTSPIYTVTNPGFYYCTVSNYCGVTIDTIHVSDVICECTPLVPNIFSPNGDGINDEFRPDIGCTPSSFKLKIFNRAGQLIFESNTLTNYWKGTFQNKPVPIGTYYYILKVKGQSDPIAREKAGSITVIR